MQRINNPAILEIIEELKRDMKIKSIRVLETNSFAVKSSAVFGFGNSALVLLRGNNMFRYSEIRMILAHEFAHHKLKHTLKAFIFSRILPPSLMGKLLRKFERDADSLAKKYVCDRIAYDDLMISIRRN